MDYQISTKEFVNYKPQTKPQPKQKNWVARAKAEMCFWACACVVAHAALFTVIGFAIKFILFPNS